jgi:hypothetical protein
MVDHGDMSPPLDDWMATLLDSFQTVDYATWKLTVQENEQLFESENNCIYKG